MEKDELKIKFIKLKLHFIYCGIIFFMIAALLFTTRNYSNQDLSQQLSLAATLIGIVLSVIAIFMSIMGEKDVSSTKDKLVCVSDDLISITNRLNNSIESINNIVNMKEEITQGNKKILDLLNKSVNTSINSQENNSNEDDNYVKVFKSFFSDDDPIQYYAISIIYFNKEYSIKYRKALQLEAMVKFMMDVLNYEKKEVASAFFSGMCFIFVPNAIGNSMFKEYIDKEIEKNNTMKNLIDEYITNLS